MFPTVAGISTRVVGAVRFDRPGGFRGGVELEGRARAGSFECAPSGVRQSSEQIPVVLSTEAKLPDAVQMDVETGTEIGMSVTVMLRTLRDSSVKPRHSQSPHG